MSVIIPGMNMDHERVCIRPRNVSVSLFIVKVTELQKVISISTWPNRKRTPHTSVSHLSHVYFTPALHLSLVCLMFVSCLSPFGFMSVFRPSLVCLLSVLFVSGLSLYLSLFCMSNISFVFCRSMRRCWRAGRIRAQRVSSSSITRRRCGMMTLSHTCWTSMAASLRPRWRISRSYTTMTVSSEKTNSYIQVSVQVKLQVFKY